MTGPSAAWLSDGRRIHLQHGPIDLIIEAVGAADSVDAAYRAAWRRFETVLEELVSELPRLRSLCPPEGLGLMGSVARRMETACRPHAGYGLTPMAAVAGAVADEILAAMVAEPDLRRAYVNNGGDIALALGEGERFEIAMVAAPERPVRLGMISLRSGDPAGLATSGRHGRSFSLGIADSVTVLAETAAAADAAATLIANAVDLPGSTRIERVPARDLNPDSDLGDRLVTVDVHSLSSEDVSRALEAGAARACDFHNENFLAGAALSLDGQVRIVGNWPGSALATVSKERTPPLCLDSQKSGDYKNIAQAQCLATPR